MNPVSYIFADVMMGIMVVMLVAAVLTVLFSKIRSVRNCHTPAVVNGIHGKRISIAVALLLAVIMEGSYAFESDPVIVNDEMFNDCVWLGVANMMVFTSIVLLVIGVCAVCFGMYKDIRKR